MSTQTIAFNFKELNEFSSKNGIETIPPERAVQITMDSYKAGEVSDYEILKSWTTSLMPQYGPTNISEKDLNQLLGVFTSAIEEMLTECQEYVNDKENAKLLPSLNFSLELFTWIRSVAKEFGTNEITALLCFGLFLVNSYLLVLSKLTSLRNASQMLEKLLAIQALILRIISENPKSFCFDNDSVSLFSNLISHLCAVGEVTPKLDIKTAIDTWKCIARLAQQHVLLAPSESDSVEDNIWLKRPMSFLINEIGRNVQTVYKKNSLNEPIQQIEKYLKVTNFYLRLLQKLATDFRHIPFPVCDDYLNTLAILLTPPAYIVYTPVQKTIEEYITKGYKELLPFAYRNELFFEHLLSERIASINNNEAFYEILLEMIAQACRRSDVEILSSKIFDATFERLPRSAHIFISTSTYNRFIETLSSLQIHFHLDQVESALIDSILQEDIVLATTAIDIWCTIFRISNPSTRLSHFIFWRHINEHFAKFSNQPSALHVEVLLQNLYSLLTTHEQTEIWSKFNVCTLTSDRFLLAIGLDAIPNNATIIQHFTIELVRFLKESSNRMTVDNFYTIVKDLKLLSSVSVRNDELIEMLLRYLEITLKNKKFILLLESILDYLASNLEFIDDSKLLKILTAVSMELSLFKEPSTKLSLIGFLRKILKIPRLAKHSEELLKVLECDKLITFFGNKEQMPIDRASTETNEYILQEIVKKRSVEKTKWSHVCRIREEVSATKKIKIDNETQLLLESIENNVCRLQTVAQLNKLSTSSIEIVKEVVTKLQGLAGLS